MSRALGGCRRGRQLRLLSGRQAEGAPPRHRPFPAAAAATRGTRPYRRRAPPAGPSRTVTGCLLTRAQNTGAGESSSLKIMAAINSCFCYQRTSSVHISAGDLMYRSIWMSILFGEFHLILTALSVWNPYNGWNYFQGLNQSDLSNHSCANSRPMDYNNSSRPKAACPLSSQARRQRSYVSRRAGIPLLHLLHVARWAPIIGPAFPPWT